MADFEKPGDQDVIDKLVADFKAKGIDLSESQLRRQMNELKEAARRQIMSETK
jgi:hypothetical protein